MTTTFPPAIRYLPHQHGWDVFDRSGCIGWVYHRSDGPWMADRGNGDYLAGEFQSRDEAVRALREAAR